MMRIPMSAAGSALFRALLARAEVPRDRILLTSFRSVDWQSLTFVGERHVIRLRVPGPGAAATAQALASNLSEAEFAVPGQIVADIALAGDPRPAGDGSIELTIEALTISD